MKKSLRTRPRPRKGRSRLLISLQFIILGTAVLSFMTAHDWMFSKSLFEDCDTMVARSLESSMILLRGTFDDNSLIESHLRANNVTESGYEVVRQYAGLDSEPLRHLRFADLVLPEFKPKSPPMTTAYQESTVVSQAPWFPHQKDCKETCCAQAIAVSLDQDDTRIINALDGPDIADVELFGHTPQRFHQFAASELTHEIVPCLKPGVIVHADSYRGPITRFFDNYRPNITVPYVLITSKTDGATPIKFFTDRLDTDPLLKAWYGINPTYQTAANHSKYRAMPLGLAGNKFRQQPDLNILMKARNYANPFAGDKSRWTNAALWETATDTTPILFVKFGLHVNALHREIPFNMACQNRTMAPLDDLSCTIDKITTPRQTYQAASKYPFGLSPPGNGKDCFRTYELLLNGVIPIIKAQPENELLFKDLPVLELDHWNYNQTELLNIMRGYVNSPKFLHNSFDAGWERLFLRHWRRKALKDAGRLNDIITDDQGKEYYKTWVYSLHKKPHIAHGTPEYYKSLKEKEEKKVTK